MSTSLLFKQVFIGENEFSNQEIGAEIIAYDLQKKSILLKLNTPLCDSHYSCNYAVASLRSVDHNLDILLTDKSLSFSITWIPDEKFNSENPMDISWWRGGAAAISDIYLRN